MSKPAGLLPTMYPRRDAPVGTLTFRQNHTETAARLAPYWPSDEMPLGALGLLGVTPAVIRTVVTDADAAADMIKLRTQLQAVMFKRRKQLPDSSVAAAVRGSLSRGDEAVVKELSKPMKQMTRRRLWGKTLQYIASLGGKADELAKWLDNDAASAGQGDELEAEELSIVE